MTADGTSSALELLRLLAEDAPATVLAEVPGDDEARALALRLRAAIDADRRREAGLTALVEVAGELASRTDPGAVLDAIVRRARALLGTDVAYLTLFDAEAGDTYMRATDGSVSDRFQQLRLPLGAGLGGLVAQTRTPHWTAGYPADDRYRHTAEIDAAVGDEGLVAICGTPLLVEGAFVGVLFASDRRPRAFAPEEVALLGSLAALAAVSLTQTRALAELSAAHAGIEQAAAAHDRFAAVVLEGGGVDDIAAALGDLLGAWVVVLDAAGRRTAAHGPAPAAPAEGPDPLAGSAAARQSAGTGRLVQAGGLCAVAVNAGDQRLGALVLGGAELDRAQGRTIERAAVVTALVLLFRLRAAEAEQRVRTDLLGDLLAEHAAAGRSALLERGRLLGLDLDAPHVVLSASGRPVRALELSVSPHAALSGAHRGAVVALLRTDEPPAAAAAALADRLGGDVTVGAAGPVRPADGLAGAAAEARRTADALLALGLTGRGASAAELGFAGLVVAGAPDVGGFLERVLGPVLAHDARRGSDLIGTLEAYFAAGGSPTAAAGELHVHVNTVAQRLDRVGTLLGEGWQRPDRALDLQLALRLRRLSAPAS